MQDLQRENQLLKRRIEMLTFAAERAQASPSRGRVRTRLGEQNQAGTRCLCVYVWSKSFLERANVSRSGMN